MHNICNYHGKGLHKNTWELKEEFRQHNSKIETTKKTATSDSDKKASSSGGQVENMDDEDDDEDDEDFEDFDDDDDDDDDAIIGQM